jgi:hypothetical protein
MKKGILIVLILLLLIMTVLGIYFFEFNLKDVGILRGKVTLTTGSCGPMVCTPEEGCPQNSCFSRGVKKEISIRKLRLEDNLHEIPYFNNNNSDLIKTIESNETGEFITYLPVGNYSLFIVENGSGSGWEQIFELVNITFNEYCGRTDSFGNSFVVCPIEIKKDQTTIFDLDIDYSSV